MVRPALADYGGFGIISGTAAGRDHFFEAYQNALKHPDTWDVFVIPVTDTTALHPDEIEEMRAMMTPNQFAREMLCSFDAPVEGSYYGDLIVALEANGQVTNVPYDRQAGVITAWDLGMHDATAIWFAQQIGREVHVIDYLQESGKPLDWFANQLTFKGYQYQGHIFPHDVKVRELGTGRSRFDVLSQLGIEPTICPKHNPEDRIAAVRSLLPGCWFDRVRTEPGMIALKSYQAAPAEKLGTMMPRALHNWASHGSDAFGHLAVGLDRVAGWGGMSGAQPGFRNFRLKGLARRL